MSCPIHDCPYLIETCSNRYRCKIPPCSKQHVCRKVKVYCPISNCEALRGDSISQLKIELTNKILQKRKENSTIQMQKKDLNTQIVEEEDEEVILWKPEVEESSIKPPILSQSKENSLSNKPKPIILEEIPKTEKIVPHSSIIIPHSSKIITPSSQTTPTISQFENIALENLYQTYLSLNPKYSYIKNSESNNSSSSSSTHHNHKENSDVTSKSKETPPKDSVSNKTVQNSDSQPIDEDDEEQTPRTYQLEIFDLARKKNVIAFLDTGSGKTFISFLLIKEFSSQVNKDLPKGERKWTVFLVNSVPLLIQQTEVLKKLLSLKVNCFCGDMGVDFWDETKWREEIDKNQVLVMTAQVLKDLLHHSYFKIENINILIFDECHHAVKDHPYSAIVREFVDASNQPPKLFGMTASPIFSLKRIDIENCLLQFQKVEETLHCEICTTSYLDELEKNVPKPQEKEIPLKETNLPLLSIQSMSNLLPQTKKGDQIRKQLGDIQHIFDEIGSRGASLALSYIFEQDVLDLSSIQSELEESSRIFSKKFQDLKAILLDFQNDPKFSGIILVERRQLCKALFLLIQEEEIDFLKPCYLTGHGDHDVGMAFNKQKEILNKFQSGTCNLLVATKIAEEGIDIQPCKLVVQFNGFSTIKSYIQSRGRARHRSSKFYVFEGGIPLALAQEQEKIMKKAINFRKKNQILPRLFPEKQSTSILSQEEMEYIVPETNAKATLTNSKSLINRYCQKLPNPENNKECSRAIYETEKVDGFCVCKLFLPASSGVTGKIVGPLAGSEKEAERAAALKAIKKLHEIDELSDNLLPSVDETEEEEEEELETNQKFETQIPRILTKWATTFKLHSITQSNLNNISHLLLTGEILPEFSFALCTEEPIYVSIKYVSEIELSEDKITKIIEWQRLFFATLLKLDEESSEYSDSKKKYLIVPSQDNQKIAWDLMEEMKRGKPTKSWQDYLVIYEKQIYLVREISKETSLSSFPKSEYSNFVDYFQKKYNKQIQNVQDRLLDLVGVSNLNFLEQTVKTKAKGIQVPPEFCNLCGWHSSIYLPSILYKLEGLLLATELKKKLEIPISEFVCLQSITAKSSNEIYNYERWETFGDSFLKYMVSLFLFAKYPQNNEGILSRRKSNLIKNSKLFKVGNFLGPFIQLEKIQKWRPPFFQTKNRQEMKTKKVADVFEALIGCILDQSKDPFFFENNMNQAWDFVVKYFSGALERNIPPIIITQEEKNLNLKDLPNFEKQIDYSFVNKSLLVEAFTHGSQRQSQTRSYQRLEFLGDAILDFLITRYFFKKYQKGNPKELTLLRSAAVCNRTFSRISYNNTFHKYILHEDNELFRNINELGEYYSQNPETNPLSDTFFPTKVLSDVFESVAAAIFIDSQKSLPTVWRIYEKMMVPFLEKHAKIEKIPMNPVQELFEKIKKIPLHMIFDNFQFTEKKITFRKKKKEFKTKTTLFIDENKIGSVLEKNSKIGKFILCLQVLEIIKKKQDLLKE